MHREREREREVNRTKENERIKEKFILKTIVFYQNKKQRERKILKFTKTRMKNKYLCIYIFRRTNASTIISTSRRYLLFIFWKYEIDQPNNQTKKKKKKKRVSDIFKENINL